mgnify:CR=1 FL=1
MTPKALVVGMARSGIAAAAMLRRLGYEVTVNDTKPLEALQEALKPLAGSGVRYALGCPADEWVEGQTLIVVSPGVPLSLPFVQMARERKIPVIAEAELGYRYTRCPIAAITGTNGKTTTTALMGAIFRRAGYTTHVTGNIGLPISQVALDTPPGDRTAFEAPSFMLEAIDAFRPKVSAILNITEDHLNRHGTMENYIALKERVFANCREGDFVVLNYDNAVTRAMAADVKGSCRWFTRKSVVENGGFLRADGMLCMAENGRVTPIVRREDVALRGEHNLENLLAAFTAVWGMAEVSTMAAVAKSFAGVEHRIEPVRTLNGVQWFNDSIATSPTRVIAGLRAFDQKLIIIAGGSDKGISFAPLAPELIAHVKTLILTGATAQKIEDAVKADPGFAESGLVILRAADMPQAVEMARAAAQPGDIVSLSPACASFDSYPNFEARGRHYKELVNAL